MVIKHESYKYKDWDMENPGVLSDALIQSQINGFCYNVFSKNYHIVPNILNVMYIAHCIYKLNVNLPISKLVMQLYIMVGLVGLNACIFDTGKLGFSSSH